MGGIDQEPLHSRGGEIELCGLWVPPKNSGYSGLTTMHKCGHFPRVLKMSELWGRSSDRPISSGGTMPTEVTPHWSWKLRPNFAQ